MLLGKVSIVKTKHHEKKKKLEKNGFISFTVLYNSESSKEVRVRPHSGEETGGRS